MRISDGSSDVCSSDLAAPALPCSPARVSSRSRAFIRTRRPSTGTSATPSPRRTPRRHSERRAFRPRVEKRDVLKKKSSSEGPENVRSRHHFSRKIPITDGLEIAKTRHCGRQPFAKRQPFTHWLPRLNYEQC